MGSICDAGSTPRSFFGARFTCNARARRPLTPQKRAHARVTAIIRSGHGLTQRRKQRQGQPICALRWKRV
eukprot:55145-Pleurochrysis_carterae.AAC.1